MTAFPDVCVGQTDYPLRSDATARGPLRPFSNPTSTNLLSPFRLLDGPPYANGAPHLGHVLNKHLKDAVVRAAATQGFEVEWRPGWDCHGLPLELAVERAGALRTDRSAFVAAARTFAQTQVQVQADVFKQQGWSAQWEQPWRTQDADMEAGTLRVLAQLLDRGLLDVRFTAVPWCAQCQSTLSGAEQEDKPLTTETWLVPFALSDSEHVLSWTTTPWTLPLHRALVVHPEATYVGLRLGAQTAWVSEASAPRWEAVLDATRDPALVCTGAQLAGRSYTTPWKKGVLVCDVSVLAEAGTGVLHAVPGLSDLDTRLGRTYGWDLVQHLTPNGLLTQSPLLEQNGQYAGAKASAPVRSAYQDSPWFRTLPQTVEHPHCWRHHTPLLTRASRQVFLHLDAAVRARALALVDRLEFTPESGRARLLASMRGRPDWCLSRQRTWGVPMALFLDKHTGLPHTKASVWMNRVADALQTQGVEAWWSRPSSDWVQDEAVLEDLERVDDVLDVWFDSGCVPQLVGAGDVVVEGTDQHRGWFQSCLWLAAALGNTLPFHRVVTHGFVVDGAGDKLSKSKGGDEAAKAKSPAGPPPPPWHTLPTDVVRVWALSGGEGSDKSWSSATVQSAQGAVARWRGVLRFLLANVLPEEKVVRVPVSSADQPVWDRYWVVRTQEVSAQVGTLCVQGRTGEAVALATLFGEEFSAHALGSWKDRLYCAPAFTVERQALDVVLRACLEAWGAMLEVLTPRLRAEAQPFWPSSRPLGFESRETSPYSETSRHFPAWSPLATDQQSEVDRVLALRGALAPTMEELAKVKVSPVRRRVTGWAQAPVWPGQLLADALDVGQVGGSAEGLQPVVVSPHTVWVGQSSDATCPRCRRVQASFVGEVCTPCHERRQQA